MIDKLKQIPISVLLSILFITVMVIIGATQAPENVIPIVVITGMILSLYRLIMWLFE